MKCWHPECTGVHSNDRYRELCPRSLDGKRDRDRRYHESVRGVRKRIAVKYGVRLAELDEFFSLPMEQKIAYALAAG
jgi:hypothetical protein